MTGSLSVLERSHHASLLVLNDTNVDIQSLYELDVQISEEVRSYLAKSFQLLYNNNSTVSSVDDDDDVDTVIPNKNTNDLRLKQQQFGMDYVDRILTCMKTSPGKTICRINTKQTIFSKEEIRTTLRSYIEDEWLTKRCNPNGIVYSIDDHPYLENVLCIQVLRQFNVPANNAERSLIQSVYTQQGPCNEMTSSNITTHNDAEESLSSDPTNKSLSLFERKSIGKWPLNHRVVICDRFCGEAVLRGSDIYVKGILVADTGIRSNEIVAVYTDIGPSIHRPSTPPKIICQTNATTRTINTSTVTNTNTNTLEHKQPFQHNVSRGMTIEQYKGRSCVYLGLGRTVCKRSEFFNTSCGLGIEMVPKSRSVLLANNTLPILPPFSGILSNAIYLQNEPSIIVGDALKPFDNNFCILDMCCAPGGKTSHLSCLTHHLQNVTIVACDKSRKKIISVKSFLEQQGATNIVPIALDTTRCVIFDDKDQDNPCQSNDRNIIKKTVKEVLDTATVSERDRLLDVKGFYPESFDRILLDPPCSALGLRPKLQIQQCTVSELQAFANYQRYFVKEAVMLLKPGGIFTYSTCTIHSMENEEMVRYILDEYPTIIELIPIDIPLGQPGLPGCGLNDQQRVYVRRFDPCDPATDSIGFFVAKFQKKKR